jgi:hypothetical protein
MLRIDLALGPEWNLALKNPMQDLLKVVIPAVLALVGVLAGLVLAHRRWKHDEKRSNKGAYESARKDAYRELWSRLEEVNLALREHRSSNPLLFDSLKQINTFFLKNSLYLHETDQALVNNYVAALHRWRTAIYTLGNEDVQSAFSKTWIQMPASADAEIGEASRQVAEIRATILERIRKIVTT